MTRFKSGRWVPRFAVCALMLSGMPTTSAQIVELRQFHGHTISCVQSGLRSFDAACGADRGYESVFVGTVMSIDEVDGGEDRLRLRPEEVFFGAPGDQVVAKTNQRDCLPQIQVGDRWLFFLQKVETSETLRLGYEGPSQPGAAAQSEIASLRRLSHLDSSGVVTGDVTHQVLDASGSTEDKPVARHQIMAKQVEGGKTFSSVTDEGGRYEFEPLPVGKYELTSNTAPDMWAEEGQIEVKPHSCIEVDFGLKRDGRISGRVTTKEGEGVAYASVEAIDASPRDSGTAVATADEHGYYEFRGLEAKRYLVAVELNSADSPAATVYYPGTRAKKDALTIDLGAAERRQRIDIRIPRLVPPR